MTHVQFSSAGHNRPSRRAWWYSTSSSTVAVASQASSASMAADSSGRVGGGDGSSSGAGVGKGGACRRALRSGSSSPRSQDLLGPRDRRSDLDS